MSPTKSSGKAAKKAGKAQKSVLNKSGEKVNLVLFVMVVTIRHVRIFV